MCWTSAQFVVKRDQVRKVVSPSILNFWNVTMKQGKFMFHNSDYHLFNV